MSRKRTEKTITQRLGLFLFVLALVAFTAMLGLDNYQLKEDELTQFLQDQLGEEKANWPTIAIRQELAENHYPDHYPSTFAYNRAITQLVSQANDRIRARIATEGLAEGVQPWEVTIPDWLTSRDKRFELTYAAAYGPVSNRPLWWLFLTFGIAIIGGLLYILPKFRHPPGIQHDHIYHSPLTRGLAVGWRAFFLLLTVAGVLAFGAQQMKDGWLWPALSLGIAVVILVLVMAGEKGLLRSPVRSAGPQGEWSAWLGILAGLYFIGFYVLLYWAPQHIVAWVQMVDPVSRAISGNGAGQWFLYGLMYTVIVAVMGIRMWAKYRHSRYQLIRTASVVFFQTAFAFLIPEILVALNQPWMDLKDIWPLNYDFFDQWQVDQLWAAGALGRAMLFWGIGLAVIGVPLMVYFLGKRWYCSWVCGCGALAENMGDPWRQLSDKSQRAWRIERWLIHGVLVFAVIMTVGVVYSYLPRGDYWLDRSSFLLLVIFGLLAAMSYVWYRQHRGHSRVSTLGVRVGLGVTVLLVGGLFYRWWVGGDTLLLIDNGTARSWYGFFVGAGFAGVVGTGFYPLMGNRVWCRFGCPLAAYLGLVQRLQSRFRITTNGGQCISCGNCSTYCEMGIDVRWYAQRGQDIRRSSCVGCGVCSAVCPRGVLRLENGSIDSSSRAESQRVIHVEESDIQILA